MLTASRRQRRHREVGSEGSPRQSSDPRNTNRIQGPAARMSRPSTVKSVTTKGLSGKCVGARAKAAVLIRRDLAGCRSNPTVAAARWRWTGQESAAVIVPAGISIAGEGPNVGPRVEPDRLAIGASTAAIPPAWRACR